MRTDTVTHLESLVPLSGEASPAHGLQPHDPVPQPEVALLLEVGQRAGAEEELEERETKRAFIGRSSWSRSCSHKKLPPIDGQLLNLPRNSILRSRLGKLQKGDGSQFEGDLNSASERAGERQLRWGDGFTKASGFNDTQFKRPGGTGPRGRA